MTKTKGRAVTTVSFTTQSLREKYQHEPENTCASLDDFFEDMDSKGYELLTFAFRGDTQVFAVFKGSSK